MIAKRYNLKRLIYILFFFLSPLSGYTQVVAVQALKMNTVYIGVSNPLVIAAENTSSKSLVVTTDNGEIRIDSFARQGHYTLWPDHPGAATIIIKKKTSKGLKTIDSTFFRVKRIPPPVPRLSGKKGGEISKAVLCIQIAPEAVMEDIHTCAKFMITGFTVVIVRRDKEIFSRSVYNKKGARIDAATSKFFQRLHNKDKVIFRDITEIGFDGFTNNLAPLNFTITNARESRKSRSKHGEEIVIDPVTGLEKVIKW